MGGVCESQSNCMFLKIKTDVCNAYGILQSFMTEVIEHSKIARPISAYIQISDGMFLRRDVEANLHILFGWVWGDACKDLARAILS